MKTYICHILLIFICIIPKQISCQLLQLLNIAVSSLSCRLKCQILIDLETIHIYYQSIESLLQVGVICVKCIKNELTGVVHRQGWHHKPNEFNQLGFSCAHRFTHTHTHTSVAFKHRQIKSQYVNGTQTHTHIETQTFFQQNLLF